VRKGTGLQDKSLIKALIQTKDWDKAIWKEYSEKHPEQSALAKKKGESIERLVDVDLSYKWRANLKYAQDCLTRLTLLADTLPPDKRQELFQLNPVLDFVRSLLGGHSTFMDEHRRLLLQFPELLSDMQQKAKEFETTKAKLSGEKLATYEKNQSEQVFSPLESEIDAVKKQILENKDDRTAWMRSILQQESVARIATEIVRACLEFCLNYYNLHVEDPAMQKVFADLFKNTNDQLESLLRQVKDKKELSRMAEELKNNRRSKRA